MIGAPVFFSFLLDYERKMCQIFRVMSQFYILAPGSTQPIGPLTLEQINAQLVAGSINLSYMCSYPGANSWMPLSQLSGVMTVGTPMPGGDVAAMGGKPDNYLVWSILGLFCCWPLAIFCIIKSSSVNSLWMQGRYAEAKSASETAKVCNIVNAVLSIIVIILYAVLGLASA